MKPCTSLLGLVQLAALATAATLDQMRSRTIYFALTDRIARSSTDTGGDACGNLNDYCGGTFKGLESKLDYIQGMGFDALWITPVVDNHDGGYHGYWARDIYSINSHYGSDSDLKSLISTAHGKGMYVIADVVANHVGGTINDISQNKPDLLSQRSSYHNPCDIDYNNQSSVETCSISGLPDLVTTNDDIRSLYKDWIKWLVGTYGFDGIRIDTVKHVEKDYWPGFCEASAVFSIGEVFEGDPNYVAPYAGLMSGVLNYPLWYPMTAFYSQTGSSQAMVDMHNTISSKFNDPGALGTFLDNHDNNRFLARINDQALLKTVLAYTILTRGIPIMYYGTEQGFSGDTNNNANREDLWRTGFNTDSDLYQFTKKLISAKKQAGGLASDDQVHLYVEDTAYAWSRAGGKLVVLTVNSGQGFSGQHCFSSQVNNGQWTDVIGTGTYSSDGNGKVCVNVSNGQPVVLLAS